MIDSLWWLLLLKVMDGTTGFSVVFCQVLKIKIFQIELSIAARLRGMSQDFLVFLEFCCASCLLWKGFVNG